MRREQQPFTPIFTHIHMIKTSCAVMCAASTAPINCSSCSDYSYNSSEESFHGSLANPTSEQEHENDTDTDTDDNSESNGMESNEETNMKIQIE